MTFVTTVVGLPEKLSITGGPTLSLDAGTVTIIDVLEYTGDPENPACARRVTPRRRARPSRVTPAVELNLRGWHRRRLGPVGAVLGLGVWLEPGQPLEPTR